MGRTPGERHSEPARRAGPLAPLAGWIRRGPWRATLGWAVLTALSTLVWLLGLPLVMMFDAPGSAENPWLWMILLGVFSLPVLCTLTPTLLWLLYALGRLWPGAIPWLRRLGHGCHALPLLSPLSVLVGIIGLQLQCSGDFSCHS